MNETSQKKPRSLKMLISASAVVLVLCVAPIGSYIFLKGGFTYRLESLNQLQPKELSPELNDAIATFAPFKGNARLVHFPGTEEQKELSILNEIDNQIVDRTRFDIVSFGPNTLNEKHEIDFQEGPGLSSEYQYVLLDTSNVVRGVYLYEDEIGKEIIRHLSVVIPMPEQRSINLKRNNN